MDRIRDKNIVIISAGILLIMTAIILMCARELKANLVIEVESLGEVLPEETVTRVELPVPKSGRYPEMVAPAAGMAEKPGKVVYITIDDGPSTTTPAILDVLDQCGIKATFFVSGQFGSDEEIIAKLQAIHQRGHNVAVHTYSHKYKDIYYSVDAYLDDYARMNNLVVRATGKVNPIYRFPGGSNSTYNAHIRGALIEEMNSRGLIYHDWNSYDGALEKRTVEEQIQTVIDQVSAKEKAVVLMHDSPHKTSILETLPAIVGELAARGYRFEILDETVPPERFIK